MMVYVQEYIYQEMDQEVYDGICLRVCIPRDGLGALYDGICLGVCIPRDGLGVVYDGICLGVCIPRDGLGAVYDGICEITAWCPVEIDRKFIKSVDIKITINICF